MGGGGEVARVREFALQRIQIYIVQKKKKIILSLVFFFFFFFFFGGGGAKVSVFFYKESNGLTDRQTDRPKPIRPFNFFEVGCITMHNVQVMALTSSIYDHSII